MPASPDALLHWMVSAYTRLLRILVLSLAVLAGVNVLGMMLLTCADVFLRAAGRPMTGAVDLVRIMGALTLVFALPYTTAVKGHVAIEYFFHKLNRRGRIVVDALVRMTGIVMFAVLAYRCFLYGSMLLRSGTVSQTLRLHMFWVPWAMGGAFALVALVVLYNLAHPGREMIKP